MCGKWRKYLVKEQGEMIDSILQRDKKSINLNRCIITNNEGEEILLLERDEVLKAVKDHFNKVSNMTKEPNATLENE